MGFRVDSGFKKRDSPEFQKLTEWDSNSGFTDSKVDSGIQKEGFRDSLSGFKKLLEFLFLADTDSKRIHGFKMDSGIHGFKVDSGIQNGIHGFKMDSGESVSGILLVF